MPQIIPADPASVPGLITDPVIQRLVEKIPAPPVYPHQDAYLFLLSSVMSQQLSTTVARAIYNRFVNLFPDGYPAAELVLQHTPEQLRTVGVSGAKAAYLQNIARFHAENPFLMTQLPQMPDEEIIGTLTQIKGVGKWTVQMVLMFPLNRPDVFPIDDLGIRQSMIQLYELGETGKPLRERLTAIAENWRPHRTLACKYLWRARDAKG